MDEPSSTARKQVGGVPAPESYTILHRPPPPSLLVGLVEE